METCKAKRLVGKPAKLFKKQTFLQAPKEGETWGSSPSLDFEKDILMLLLC